MKTQYLLASLGIVILSNNAFSEESGKYIAKIAADCFLFESGSEEVIADTEALLIEKIETLKFSASEAPEYIPDDYGGKEAKAEGKWYRYADSPLAENYISFVNGGHRIQAILWVAVSDSVTNDSDQEKEIQLELLKPGFTLIEFQEEFSKKNEVDEGDIYNAGRALMVTRRMLVHQISQR